MGAGGGGVLGSLSVIPREYVLAMADLGISGWDFPQPFIYLVGGGS